MDDTLPENKMSRRWARRVERSCCKFITYVPLIFVWSLASWALWVDVMIGSTKSNVSWIGTGSSMGAVTLFLLLMWSYMTAVFTHPGSTTSLNGDYTALESPPHATSFTVKANGEIRFCKKCQARKPDRAHHCSTCRRCILKMDHHCPWLSTCIGLRNHKAFMLFIIYTTLFCWYTFILSGAWLWEEIANDTTYLESLTPVNFILVCVVAGILGVVVGAFTVWHLIMAGRGQTTTECLEKTRYLSPLRQTLQNNYNAQHSGHSAASPGYGRQLLDIHADSAHLSYAELERRQRTKRHEEYLDEQDSSKLPHAFDLGWKRNYKHLFGPSPWLWIFPISNTTGDGWSWEASPKWLAARDRIRIEREAQRAREIQAGWGGGGPGGSEYSPDFPNGVAAEGGAAAVAAAGAGRHYLASPMSSSSPGWRAPSKADRVLGRDPNLYADVVPMRTLNKTGRTVIRDDDLLDTDDDDDDEEDFGISESTPALSKPPSSSRTVRPPNLGSTARWQAAGASGILRKTSPTALASRSTFERAAQHSASEDTVD